MFRLFRRNPPKTQVLTHAEVQTALTPAVEELLGGEFYRNAPYRWARKGGDGWHEVFELRAWKGACLSPAWGLALDGVPHLSGDAAKWHRTLKSAQADIWVDWPEQRALSFLHGEAPLLQEASDVLPRAVAQAREFWSSVKGREDFRAAHETALRPKGGTSYGGALTHARHRVEAALSWSENTPEKAEAALAQVPGTDAAREDFRRKVFR
ncbi:MAG: hypothetical protein AAFP28_07020 [Pseudomonadota bacterium]